MSKIFPRWKYHETESPVVIHDADDEKSLGDGWKDSLSELGIETHPSKRSPFSIGQKPVFADEGSQEIQKKRGRPARPQE